MTDNPQSQDLELARRGDPTAFERLVRPHIGAVRRFAFSFCADRAEADDLAQEALLKAYRSIGAFRGQCSITSWLYSVARSTFIDSRRGRLARVRSLETALEPEHLPRQGGTEELLCARDDVQRLWAALRRLEPRFRIPVVLCEIEGMSYEHVAAIEQVPVGTVRSRLSRARARLRQMLSDSSVGSSDLSPAGTQPAPASSNTQRRTEQ